MLKDAHSRLSRVKRATAWSAMASTAASSSGKSAASQASSASASTCPSSGPWAMPRAMKSAAFSGNFGALQRFGRVASSRQWRRIDAASRPRPCQHQPVAVALLAEPVEPPPRGRLIHAGEPPPAVAHGIQRPGFGIGETHAQRDASGVLGDGDRERAEPAHRIRREPQQALRRDHRGERPGIGDAAENRQQQPAIGHRLHRAGRTAPRPSA